MKLKLAILLLFSTYFNTNAQTDSIYIWNKWCARKDTLLLFNSGNNMIKVYCQGMKPADFKLKSLDNSLRIGAPDISRDTMSVLAMPYPEKAKQMRLAILDSKTSRVIKTVEFTATDIPEPIARIGSIETSEAYKKTILMQASIRPEFPKSLYSYPYRIKQYSFKLETPKGSANYTVNGFFLTTNILKEINEAPEGTMLEFYNIIATCPECSSRPLNDVKLKIKK